MDAQQFLVDFGHIANSPGGVLRLRQLVLVLASQGQLVPQDVKEHARQLMIEVDAEKQALVSSRAIRKPISLPKVNFGDQPNPIPSSWVWVRFGEIAIHNSGKTLDSARNTGQPRDYVTTSNVYWGKFDLSNLRQMLIRDEELDKCTAIKGDLLICEGGEAGRAAVWSQDYKVCFQNHVHRARFFGGINPYYAYRFFEKLNATGEINLHRKGIGISNMSGKALAMIEFPLPPLEEQTRIVARVDELMGLIDHLERQQQDSRKLQNALRKSTLQAVATAQSPWELKDAWERLEAHFGQLFDESSDTDALRKVLMDLAVSGLLSEKNDEDETAQALKQRILSAKELGITAGQFTRKKNVKMELLEETPLPLHWETISLDDAISTIDAGWSPACLPSAREDDTKWGVLKTTAVQTLRFLPEEHKELPAALEPRPQYQIELGDILITRAGPKNRVGICCVVDTAPQRLMISDKLIRIHIVDDLIDPNFVALCLSAGEPGRNIEKLKSGMADSQMNISQNKLRSITIPLPPLAEQQRILGALEGFMKTLDEYAEGLEKAARLGQQFSEAAIASITGISIEQEEEATVKAPQTELISKLRLKTAPNVKAQAPLATILARHDGELSARDLWQRFGGEIDAFYAQLKTEVAHGWIAEPAVAEMLERPVEAAGT